MKNPSKKIVLMLMFGACAITALAIVHAPRKSLAATSPDEIKSRFSRSIRDADWTGIDAAASEWMRTSPDQGEAARLRGYAALALGRVGEAEGHFLRSSAPPVPPKQNTRAALLPEDAADSPISLLLAADRAAQKGDEQGAHDLVTKALEAAPSLSVARIFRASLDTRANRFDAALEDLAAVGDADPAAEEARLLRVLIWLSQGRNELARSALAALVESVPSQPLALNTLGILCAMDQKWSNAADAFAKAYALAPQFSDAKRNWRLAQAASTAPGTILALRSQVQDATGRATDAISREAKESISAAWATGWGNTFRDWAPYAKAGGALSKNPELAIGGTFLGDVLNRAGERGLKLADQNTSRAGDASRDWDRSILDIMSVGATRFPNSPQAKAYSNRLSGLTVRPELPSSSTSFGNAAGGDRGGVSAELTDFSRDGNGNIIFKKSDDTQQELVVVYPLFGNR